MSPLLEHVLAVVVQSVTGRLSVFTLDLVEVTTLNLWRFLPNGVAFPKNDDAPSYAASQSVADKGRLMF